MPLGSNGSVLGRAGAELGVPSAFVDDIAEAFTTDKRFPVAIPTLIGSCSTGDEAKNTSSALVLAAVGIGDKRRGKLGESSARGGVTDVCVNTGERSGVVGEGKLNVPECLLPDNACKHEL